jgi:hypothetical protein
VKRFMVDRDEACMVAKAHLEECRRMLSHAQDWKANPQWSPSWAKNRAEYLQWAKEAATRAKHWYAKLGLTFGRQPLRDGEPPRDGKWYDVFGQVVGPDGACMVVSPFHFHVRWTENPGESAGWHQISGMAVACTPDDTVTIFKWREVPKEL